MTTTVWYAAYGSNLSARRFAVYLRGGPVPGSPTGRIEEGARDPTPPTGDEPIEIPHRLYFAGAAASWGGGGVAFLDPSPETVAGNRARGRAWRLTVEQFADVYRQENKTSEPVEIDIDELRDRGHLDLLSGWYGRVLHIGTHRDGAPIVSFTGADPHRLERRPAAPAYLDIMATGLAESHRLDEATISHYLDRVLTTPTER